MPEQQIVNALPQAVLLGANDLSEQPPVILPAAVPSYLPKFYILAAQGPLDDQLVTSAPAQIMYGSSTFDERSVYATHATALLNKIMAQGTNVMIRRLQPTDAPKPAAVRLYLDVLGPIAIPLYERNSDGSYVTDSNTGALVPTGSTTSGYKVKFVTMPIGVDGEGNDLFGLGTQIAGDQTDSASSTQSKRYPIIDADVPSFGLGGNNNAFRLYAPTALSSPALDTRILTDELVYPFKVQFATRPNASTSASVVPTQSGDQSVDICFVPGTINKNTDQQMYVGAQVPSAWQDINDPSGVPNTYGPWGRFKSYDSYIATLVEEFYTAEFPVMGDFSDFTGAADEQNLFNFVSGVSSQNVPYASYIFVQDGNAVTLTANTNVYAQNGGDGTITAAIYDTLVGLAIQEYADPNNPIQDPISHPESDFVDTGFSLATKKMLAAFISNRKDTFLTGGTHEVGGPPLTAAEESSIGLSLSTAYSAFPESDTYGTPVVRAMVVAGSFTLGASVFSQTNPVPLTMEIAIKSAQYMGSGDGKWKGVQNFDAAPRSVILFGTGINVTFVPPSQAVKDWAVGLVRSRSFSRGSWFFPALKTLYPDDTSVLNSYFTAHILMALEKICIQSWQQFTGSSKLTDAQLVAGVDGFISNAVLGRFDGRVQVVSDTTVTGQDAQRGYSWTTVVSLYAGPMRTVGSFTINTLRLSQLQASTTGATTNSTTTS